MIRKKDLIRDIKKYTPAQIAEAIYAEEVTFYELSKETKGSFTPLLRRNVEKELDVISLKSADINSTTEGLSLKSANVEKEQVYVEDSIDSFDQFDESDPYTDNNQYRDENIDQMLESERPSMFRKPFSFKGRIRRREFGLSLILFYACAVIVNLLLPILVYDYFNSYDVYQSLSLLIKFPLYWFVLAQSVKRCHDRGCSWFYILIPFYGLWMLFGEGEIGENEYGNSPK